MRPGIGTVLALAGILTACAGGSAPVAPAAAPSAPATIAAGPTSTAPSPSIAAGPATAAPSSPTAAPAQSNRGGPCQLVTADDIQGALGVAVSGAGTETAGSLCEWKLADGSRLHLHDFGMGGATEFQTMTSTLCGGVNNGGTTCTAVTGLGQQAMFVETHGPDPKNVTQRSVVVLLPDDLVVVGQSNGSNGPPSSEDALVKLARVVVSHAA